MDEVVEFLLLGMSQLPCAVPCRQLMHAPAIDGVEIQAENGPGSGLGKRELGAIHNPPPDGRLARRPDCRCRHGLSSLFPSFSLLGECGDVGPELLPGGPLVAILPWPFGPEESR